MSVRVRQPRARLVITVVLLVSGASASFAQAPAHQHDAPTSDQHDSAQPGEHQHDMSAMSGGIPMTRDGSGTSWLPDESPMYALRRQSGRWMLMLHANAFVQYFKETGDRGSDQFGSINWLMGMAHRAAGKGQLMLRGMVSVESPRG